MKKIVGILFVMLITTDSINGSALDMNTALSILKENNLEIKIAKLDQSIAKKDEKFASGNHYGKIDLMQDIAYSDDAGNVFGFKLTAREATMVDFGMYEMQSEQNPGGTPPDQPGNTLNYPDAESFFQSKIRYEVPFFTGYKLTNYVSIMKAMTKMKTLDKHKVINEKIYQVRKSFYDMALLKNSTKNLKNILNNIHKLEKMTKNMIDVGYAKKVDLLEVRAKKGNVERLLMDLKLNQKLLYHYISFLLNKKVTDIIVPKSSMPMPRINSKEILENNVDIKRALVGLK
ncbi:MAG: TolC family protein, partial [Campylobacterota bacterium]|nr:TolC family protein [Campylobacterota bacterium]